MARDYKHSGRKKNQIKRPPGWLWFGAGLAVGLFVAGLVYLEENRASAPGRTAKTVAPEPSADRPQRDTRDVRKNMSDPVPPPPKPRFDFYTLLPEMEVVIPDEEIAAATKGNGPPVAAVKESGTYILQAGSFRKFEEADRLKATLALQLGMQAEIQTVTIDGKDTWHRVRLGPFSDLDELNQARARLRAHEIEAMPLRVKG